MNTPTSLNVLDSSLDDQAAWVDKKRKLWLFSPAIPVIGTAAVAGYILAPKKMRALAWIGPMLVHGIIPALDYFIGIDAENPPSESIQALEKDPYYARAVKAYIPLQYLVLLGGTFVLSRKNVPLIDKLALSISLGTLNGIGINTAHELAHKPGKTEHLLSLLALAPTGYGHFRVEHTYGHHKRVATPEDPASSKMGESFWEFLPRTVIGGFKSAIEIETKRLARKNKSFWSVENELLQGWAMTGALTAFLVTLFGRRILPFFILQGVYGFSLLEVINYIEHYGLLRPTENGKYVRTQPEHSWNSNHLVTNLLLYQLQRHSDHHANPTRSFQALRHFDHTPQLPSGYATMLLPAYIPPLWFYLMDKRVVAHYKGDLNKVNIFQKARNRLFKQFGGQDLQQQAV